MKIWRTWPLRWALWAALLLAPSCGSDTNLYLLLSGLDGRPANTTCIAPERPPAVLATYQNAFPSLPAFSAPLGLVQAPADSARWFVLEKAGRVRVFANNIATSSSSTFLDISSSVNSASSEAGLLGLAFHPSFPGTPYAWVSYTASVMGGGLASRLSRFETMDGGTTLDASSETIVLEIPQPFENHNGGNIIFGPDGYLYLGLGDGGSAGDPTNQAQNTNTLLGSMLRIDVSNTDMTCSLPYAIPAGNPFEGAGCPAGGGASDRRLIYAWGFRNPWRWSFDASPPMGAPSPALWAGDVGQANWEEVDLVEVGNNYGWNILEGTHCYPPATTSCNTAGMTPPKAEYGHDRGFAITGGYVYRGSAIASLQGVYVYGDFGSGTIFGLFDPYGTPDQQALFANTGRSIASFGEDVTSRELYFVDYVSGQIFEIIAASDSVPGELPVKLSDSGCVSSSDPKVPAPGLVPYDIRVPFWTDGAQKERFVAIPDGSQISVDPVDGDWDFPIGTVFLKYFHLGGQLIETRLFVHHNDGGWGGYSYEWDALETDATLVGDAGMTKMVGSQQWLYPSRAQCLFCHSGASGGAIGPETRQLDRSFLYPTGRTANQLSTFEINDFLDSAIPALEPLPLPSDTSKTLEQRAKAYLHANCAYCHQPGGNGQGPPDLRFNQPLSAMGICNEAPQRGDLGNPSALIVKPGVPADSILSLRMHDTGANRMPPLGSFEVDPDGTAVVDAWITSLTACP